MLDEGQHLHPYVDDCISGKVLLHDSGSSVMRTRLAQIPDGSLSRGPSRGTPPFLSKSVRTERSRRMWDSEETAISTERDG